jgi:hypothetical protein
MKSNSPRYTLTDPAKIQKEIKNTYNLLHDKIYQMNLQGNHEIYQTHLNEVKSRVSIQYDETEFSLVNEILNSHQRLSPIQKKNFDDKVRIKNFQIINQQRNLISKLFPNRKDQNFNDKLKIAKKQKRKPIKLPKLDDMSPLQRKIESYKLAHYISHVENNFMKSSSGYYEEDEIKTRFPFNLVIEKPKLDQTSPSRKKN